MEAISSKQEESAKSPMRTGILLFLLSEAFLFGSLFWTYYYLKFNAGPAWPPQHPEALLASINTGFLLASSITIWLAGYSIRKGNEKGLAFWLAVTLAFGATFLGITVFEWTNEGFQPWTNAYGSIFYTLTGFHALHVFLGVMLLSSLLIRTLRHRFSANNSLGVHIGSYYWHFVDFIWIFVFTTLFIIR